MILAASGAMRPFNGRVAGLSEVGLLEVEPHGSFERSYMPS